MLERLKRIGGYAVAGIIGAVLISFPGRSDNPLPNGGQIARHGAGQMFTGGLGGVCTGTATVNAGNQANCSGDWFSGEDVSALYAINTYNELVTIAGKLDTLNTNLGVLHQDNTALSTQLQNQIVGFNKQLQKSIAQEFADLPKSQEMQKFHDQVVQDAIAAMQKQPAK